MQPAPAPVSALLCACGAALLLPRRSKSGEAYGRIYLASVTYSVRTGAIVLRGHCVRCGRPHSLQRADMVMRGLLEWAT